MRIVLDTNCLIQSISPKSAYHDIWLSILNGKNTLCVSNEILEEYAEILNRLAGETTAKKIPHPFTMWNKYLVELQKNSPYHLPSILHVDAMLGRVLDRTAQEVEES